MLRYLRMSLAVVLLTVLSACTSTELGPPVSNDKKLLGFACDLVTAAYLKNNVAELERIPIDGLIISVHPDSKRIAEGQLYRGRINLARGGKYKREDYQQAIADLKSTEFKRFTDNFIDLTLCAGNRYDWFDEDWSVYAHNAAVLAWVAKQAGLKGLVIDVEQYGGMNVPVPHPLRYSWRKDRSQRSFDEVAQQVRKRGREFMAAITAAYPDITVIMIPTLGWNAGPAQALLPAFADGLIEGLGPRVTLIDGMENAYPLMLHSNFSKLRAFAEKGGLDKSQIPAIYKKRVQYGLGLWIDFDARTNGTYNGWRSDPEDLDKNYRSPERLEHSLYNALAASDKYVWLFVIHPQVWWRPELTKKQNHPKQLAIAGTGWRCKLCPHPEIPEEYIDAIGNCRKPHDLNWGPERVRSMEDDALYSWCPMLAKDKDLKPEDLSAIGPNILKNASFETWTKPGIPDSWRPGTEEHSKYVSREDTIVKEGSHSAKVSSTARVKHVYLIQSFPAAEYAGKTITCGIWCKSSIDELGNVNVIDFIETAGRKDEVATKMTRYEGKDGWWFITATKTIRKNATRISIYLDFNMPLLEGGALYYDGAIAVVRE